VEAIFFVPITIQWAEFAIAGNTTSCGDIAYDSNAIIEYTAPGSVVSTAYTVPIDLVNNEISFTLDSSLYDTIISDYSDFATFASSPQYLSLKFTGSHTAINANYPDFEVNINIEPKPC